MKFRFNKCPAFLTHTWTKLRNMELRSNLRTVCLRATPLMTSGAKKIPKASLWMSRQVASTTTKFFIWAAVYMVPAIVSGLFFAAALGRYTIETQFAQNAFQNYLLPYQASYKECLTHMNTLRARWENVELLIKFARNMNPSASSPIVVFSYEGPIISTDDKDTASTVLGQIAVEARKVEGCMYDVIGKAEALGTLLGEQDWMNNEITHRDERLNEYRSLISKEWETITHIDKWEMLDKAISRVRDKEFVPKKFHTDLAEYAEALGYLNGYLARLHRREENWLKRLDQIFRNQLALRSSRTIWSYLESITRDLIPSAWLPPISAPTSLFLPSPEWNIGAEPLRLKSTPPILCSRPSEKVIGEP